jgi:hypothetical protein
VTFFRIVQWICWFEHFVYVCACSMNEIVFLSFMFGPIYKVVWILQIVGSSLFIQLSGRIPMTYNLRLIQCIGYLICLIWSKKNGRFQVCNWTWKNIYFLVEWIVIIIVLLWWYSLDWVIIPYKKVALSQTVAVFIHRMASRTKACIRFIWLSNQSILVCRLLF